MSSYSNLTDPASQYPAVPVPNNGMQQPVPWSPYLNPAVIQPNSSMPPCPLSNYAMPVSTQLNYPVPFWSPYPPMPGIPLHSWVTSGVSVPANTFPSYFQMPCIQTQLNCYPQPGPIETQPNGSRHLGFDLYVTAQNIHQNPATPSSSVLPTYSRPEPVLGWNLASSDLQPNYELSQNSALSTPANYERSGAGTDPKPNYEVFLDPIPSLQQNNYVSHVNGVSVTETINTNPSHLHSLDSAYVPETNITEYEPHLPHTGLQQEPSEMLVIEAQLAKLKLQKAAVIEDQIQEPDCLETTNSRILTRQGAADPYREQERDLSINSSVSQVQDASSDIDYTNSNSSVIPAPPPPPPQPSLKPNLQSTIRTAVTVDDVRSTLLQQIRKGAQLTSVDSRKRTPLKTSQSFSAGQKEAGNPRVDLHDALKRALSERYRANHNDFDEMTSHDKPEDDWDE